MTRPRRGRLRVVEVENAPRRAAANQNRVRELEVHVADGAGPPSSGLISALLALMDKHRPPG